MSCIVHEPLNASLHTNLITSYDSKMHVLGLIKRSLVRVMCGAAGAQDAVGIPAAKNLTAKEIREEEKRLGEHVVEEKELGDSYCYS